MQGEYVNFEQGDDVPTRENVVDAATALHLNMRRASSEAARSLPGLPAVGGVNAGLSSPSSPAAAAGTPLGVQLGLLIEAIRVGVELFAQVVSMRLACA